MIETAVLLPRADNLGARFPPRVWREVEQRLLTLAGGWTFAGEVSGAWLADGTTYRDVSREYTVTLESWRQVATFLAFADWARLALRQEAIYVSIAGIPEILRG